MRLLTSKLFKERNCFLGEISCARWQRIQGGRQRYSGAGLLRSTNRREPNFEDLRNTFDVDLLDRFRLPARQQISLGLGARSK